MSLFDDLGGEAAIDAAVDLFYQKVLADDRINEFFDGINMTRQKAMQKKFLTYAFGGPNNYNGVGMRKVHKNAVDFGLNDSHFDAVVEDLASTLREMGVPEVKIAEAGRIAESTRDDVLNKSQQALG